MPFAPETNGDLVPRLARGGRTAALFQRRLHDIKASARGFLSTDAAYRFACAVTHCALGVYWYQLQRGHREPWDLPALNLDEPLPTLAPRTRELAEEIGALLAQSEPIAAGY